MPRPTAMQANDNNATAPALTPEQARYNEAIHALRTGLALCSHHARLTKRAEKVFQDCMPEGLTVHVTRDATFQRVRVWGRGLPYSEGVELSWIPSSHTLDGNDPWPAKFARALGIADCRDYQERQAQEAALAPQLASIEAQIATLRERAAALVAALPVPPSATIRTWEHEGPSSELAKRFPFALGTPR